MYVLEWGGRAAHHFAWLHAESEQTLTGMPEWARLLNQPACIDLCPSGVCSHKQCSNRDALGPKLALLKPCHGGAPGSWRPSLVAGCPPPTKSSSLCAPLISRGLLGLPVCLWDDFHPQNQLAAPLSLTSFKSLLKPHCLIKVLITCSAPFWALSLVHLLLVP